MTISLLNKRGEEKNKQKKKQTVPTSAISSICYTSTSDMSDLSPLGENVCYDNMNCREHCESIFILMKYISLVVQQCVFDADESLKTYLQGKPVNHPASVQLHIPSLVVVVPPPLSLCLLCLKIETRNNQKYLISI